MGEEEVMRTRKITWLLELAFLLILINRVEAAVIQTTSGYIFTDASYLDIALIKQDPYPASPGSYVDLLFKVENRGAKSLENVVIELLPRYPFFLDKETNATTYLGRVNSLQMGENAILLKYRVRVDDYAIGGENEIGLRYTYDSKDFYLTKSFNITILDPRTEFEIVARQSAENILSLNILNVGNNTARSVVVKLPEQKDFKIIGFNSYVVETLNPGEQKEVSFSATPLRRENSNLIVEVHYTDKLGIRRIIQKNVSVIPSSTEDFGVVVQELTANSVTLAIVNMGINPVYSIVVSIPQQPNFRAVGSYASVIGNLDAGDYTLVTFQIQRIGSSNASAIPVPRRMGNFTPENLLNISSRGLIVEISYTDRLGIRRTIQKSVELDASMQAIANITSLAQRRYQRQTYSGLTYILIGIFGIVIIIGLIIFFRRGIRKRK